MKMDHHCPWINNCVGHENHASFLRFTFYVPLGCLHGAILNANFLYRVVTNVSGHFVWGGGGGGGGEAFDYPNEVQNGSSKTNQVGLIHASVNQVWHWDCRGEA